MSAEGARLKQLLSQVTLAPQQAQLVDLLLSLDDEGDDAAGPDGAAAGEDAGGELAGLRQVNDTTAAALGACPLCWGGDRGCQVCAGRGRPGFAEPDLELFRELVVPAVRRARALAGRRRPDADEPRR